MARCRQWGRLGVAAMVVVLAVPRCLAQVLVDAAETSGYPGWTVPLSVSHGANGAAPSSVGLALFFSDPRNVNVVANSDGRPDCSAHEAVSTPGQFVFWPVGCRYEDDECDTVRAPFVDLSGAQPNLPSGELFRCTVRIAGSASPGTYPVRVIDPDAAAQNGVTVTASADDGVVHVLQPPGGGGCMIDPTNRGTAVWFALLALLVGAGARSARTRRWQWAFGGHPLIRRPLNLLAAINLLLAGGVAVGEASEFAAEGVWVRGAEQGTWHAVLGIDGTGAISGRVGFRGLTDFPKGNLLATWSAGGIQKGFLFYQGTIARAGRLRGGIGLNGVSGEFTLPGGAVATWRLQSIRATRQKFAPVRAGELLARGSPAAVMVTIDDYPAVRAARERVADLARYEWDSDAAQIAYESAVADLQESVLRTLAGSAALLLSTPVGCPNFNFICRTVPRSPPSCPCPRSKRCKVQGCTSLPSSKACP